MRPELQKLLKAQADWQRSRVVLSWPEKIRMAEIMRESARQLRTRQSANSDEREEEPGRRP